MKLLEKIPYEKAEAYAPWKRILVYAVFVIFFVVLFYFFMYKERNEKIGQLRVKLVKLEEEIKVNKIKEKKLIELKEKVRKLNKELNIARIQLPEGKEIPELLTYISKLGTQEGVDFLLFKPMEESPRDFYSEIPLVMKISGDYHGVVQFFDRIGNLSRIVNLSEIKMGEVKLEGETNIITTSALATTFMFKDTGIEGDKEKKRYMNSNYGFSLFYPIDWSYDESGALGTAVILKNTNAGLPYNPTINVTIRYTQETNLKIYIDELKNQIKTVFPDYTIESEGETFLSDLAAYQILSTYTQGGNMLKARNTYLIQDKKVYIINTIALRPNYKDFEESFDDIVSSLVVQKGKDMVKIGVLPISTYDSKEKRDPFRTLIVEEEEISSEEMFKEDRPPLESYDLSQIHLVGIFWGELGRYGLVELPDNKEYTVKNNTLIGKRNGKIVDITDNGMVVEEEVTFRRGGQIATKKVRVVIKFKGKEG